MKPQRPRLRPLAALFLFALAATFVQADDRAAQIAQATAALHDQLVATRRDLHEHPELSNDEVRTARVVAERLHELGFDEVRTNVAKHGVVGLLKGAKPGPVVAWRADMDALPITEANDVPYKSKTPGVMHACGHDAHTTVGLGVAEVLSKMRGEIHGSVKFLFQPAEEGATGRDQAGALLMIKEGALENPKPLAIFGFHTSPELEAGVIGYRAGPAQASADGFNITIRGKMSHAASPHKGIDTIVVAAECVTALQTIKSRRIDTFEPVILTIGTIHGGTKQNIIPDEVKLSGTVRTFSEDARTQIEQLMRETLAGVTSAYGAKYELDYERGTMVVVNDPRLVAATLPSLRRAAGETNVVEVPKRMGAEDFSFYGRVVPGFFMRLGAGNKARGITSEGHTPTFDVDEACLEVGVKTAATALLDFLDQHAAAK
ncbi:MAG: amidohydrolase [Pedosphaera sp.]|nr:amidohydrolase [Pedosphaera sp.]